MCPTFANHLAGDCGEPAAAGDYGQQDGEDGGGGGGDAREQRGVGDDGQDGGRGGHRPQPPHHLNIPSSDERSQLRAQGKSVTLFFSTSLPSVFCYPINIAFHQPSIRSKIQFTSNIR